MASSTAGRYVKIHLVRVKDKEPILERIFSLDDRKPSVTIGRSSSKEGLHSRQEETNNAYFKSAIISRDHAELNIFPDSKDLLLRDTRSMHGTAVNGNPVEAGKSVTLAEGDIVTLGDNITFGNRRELTVTFRVHWSWVEPKQRSDRPLTELQPDSQLVKAGVVGDGISSGWKESVVEVETDNSLVQKPDAATSKPSLTFRVPESESEAEGSDLGERVYTDDIDDDDLLFVKTVSKGSSQTHKVGTTRSHAMQKEGASPHKNHTLQNSSRYMYRHVPTVQIDGVPGSSPNNPFTIEESLVSANLSRASSLGVQSCSPEPPASKTIGAPVNLVSVQKALGSQRVALLKRFSTPPISIASDSVPSSPWLPDFQNGSNIPLQSDTSFQTLRESDDIELPVKPISKDTDLTSLEESASQTKTPGTALPRGSSKKELVCSNVETDCNLDTESELENDSSSISLGNSDSDLQSEASDSEDQFEEHPEGEKSDAECVSDGSCDDTDWLSMAFEPDLPRLEKEEPFPFKNHFTKHFERGNENNDLPSGASLNTDKSKANDKKILSNSFEISKINVDSSSKMATSGREVESKDVEAAGMPVNRLTQCDRGMPADSQFHNSHTNSRAQVQNTNDQESLSSSTIFAPQVTNHPESINSLKSGEQDQLRDNGASSTTAYQPWASRARHSYPNDKAWHFPDQATSATSTTDNGIHLESKTAKENDRNRGNIWWNMAAFPEIGPSQGLNAFFGSCYSTDHYPKNGKFNNETPPCNVNAATLWSEPSSYMDPYSSWSSRNMPGISFPPAGPTQLSVDSSCKRGKERALPGILAPAAASSGTRSEYESLPSLTNPGNTLGPFTYSIKKRRLEDMITESSLGRSRTSTNEKNNQYTRVPVSQLLREQPSLPSPPTSEESTLAAAKPTIATGSDSVVAEEATPILDPTVTATSLNDDCAMTQPEEALETGNPDLQGAESSPSSTEKSHKRVLDEDERGEQDARPSKKSKLGVSKSSALPFIMGTVVGGIGMIGALISLPDSLF